jgi:hypothetical protein
MKKAVLFFLILLAAQPLLAQIPKSGTYTYKFCEAEYNKCMRTCKVVIKGGNITVYVPGGLTTEKNAILEKGIIMKHKSGKWIIGKSKKDSNAPVIGGCSDGPTIIDFKRKRYWTC